MTGTCLDAGASAPTSPPPSARALPSHATCILPCKPGMVGNCPAMSCDTWRVGSATTALPPPASALCLQKGSSVQIQVDVLVLGRGQCTETYHNTKPKSGGTAAQCEQGPQTSAAPSAQGGLPGSAPSRVGLPLGRAACSSSTRVRSCATSCSIAASAAGRCPPADASACASSSATLSA